MAIIEFFNVTREISKKHHVVNLALYDSFSQLSWLLDGNSQNCLGAAISITKTYHLLKLKTHQAILVGSRGRCWVLESLVILYYCPVCMVCPIMSETLPTLCKRHGLSIHWSVATFM